MTQIKRCWRPQGRFLREFARSGSISNACRAAGLARRTVYRWRDADADFRARWEKARVGAVERLQDEVMERALVGTQRPVWQNGRIAGHERGARLVLSKGGPDKGLRYRRLPRRGDSAVTL